MTRSVMVLSVRLYLTLSQTLSASRGMAAAGPAGGLAWGTGLITLNCTGYSALHFGEPHNSIDCKQKTEEGSGHCDSD